MNGTLLPFQTEDVSYAYHKAQREAGLRLLNANDTGTGKTIESIGMLYYLSLAKNYGLVVVPKSMKNKWAATLKSWLGVTALVLNGNAATRQEQLERVVGKRIIVITTYGTMKRHPEFFIAHPPEFLIADEAHRLCNPQAAITRLFLKITKRGARNLLFLTATPIEKNPAQYWAMLHMLYPNDRDMPELRSFRHFEYTFCRYVTLPSGHRKCIGTQNASRLQEILRRCMIRRTKASVLKDLPPMTEEIVYVDLDPKQAAEQHRIYTELKLVQQTLVDGELLTASNAAALLLRLRQVCVSPALVGGPDVSPKYDYILDKIKGSATPLCVFSPFRVAPLEKRLEEEGISFVTIDGAASSKKRDEAVEAVNSGTVQVCLYTQAGGEGIDLIGSSHLIFLAEDWSTRTMQQARDRLHRNGQTQKVLIEYLVTQGTVEEYVHGLLKQKNDWTAPALVEHIVRNLPQLERLELQVQEAA